MLHQACGALACGSRYRVVPAGAGCGGEVGAPAVGAAGQRLLVRSTSGYQLSGSITTLLTFRGPAMSAVYVLRRPQISTGSRTRWVLPSSISSASSTGIGIWPAFRR